MLSAKQALLVMAKRPAPGQTKTRLCPPLSFQEAAELYTAFLRDTLEIARAARARLPALTCGVAFSPVDAADYFAQLAPDFVRIPQHGTNLGERLDFVLATAFEQDYDQVVAINSDGPTLPPAYVVQAFALLADDPIDAVFGPCEDGGYYLIGLKERQPRLVREVEMSTPHVLADTLALARAEGLRVELLPTWYDVDTVEELARLQAEVAALPEGRAIHTRQFLRTFSPRITP